MPSSACVSISQVSNSTFGTTGTTHFQLVTICCLKRNSPKTTQIFSNTTSQSKASFTSTVTLKGFKPYYWLSTVRAKVAPVHTHPTNEHRRRKAARRKGSLPTSIITKVSRVRAGTAHSVHVAIQPQRRKSHSIRSRLDHVPHSFRSIQDADLMSLQLEIIFKCERLRSRWNTCPSRSASPPFPSDRHPSLRMQSSSRERLWQPSGICIGKSKSRWQCLIHSPGGGSDAPAKMSRTLQTLPTMKAVRWRNQTSVRSKQSAK